MTNISITEANCVHSCGKIWHSCRESGDIHREVESLDHPGDFINTIERQLDFTTDGLISGESRINYGTQILELDAAIGYTLKYNHRFTVPGVDNYRINLVVEPCIVIPEVCGLWHCLLDLLYIGVILLF